MSTLSSIQRFLQALKLIIIIKIIIIIIVKKKIVTIVTQFNFVFEKFFKYCIKTIKFDFRILKIPTL